MNTNNSSPFYNLAKQIERYLQNDFADEWSTKVTDDSIHCDWGDIFRFTITFDDEEVFVNGADICLDMLYGIKEIIDKAKESEKPNNVISMREREKSDTLKDEEEDIER